MSKGGGGEREKPRAFPPPERSLGWVGIWPAGAKAPFGCRLQMWPPLRELPSLNRHRIPALVARLPGPARTRASRCYLSSLDRIEGIKTKLHLSPKILHPGVGPRCLPLSRVCKQNQSGWRTGVLSSCPVLRVLGGMK